VLQLWGTRPVYRTLKPGCFITADLKTQTLDALLVCSFMVYLLVPEAIMSNDSVTRLFFYGLFTST
jgi:hypothetical protein